MTTIICRKVEKMILTKEIFNEISINGALTKEQVKYLGGEYPLPKGWVKSLIGRDMFDFMYDELMAMKQKKIESKHDKKLAKHVAAKRREIETQAAKYGGTIKWH